MYNINMYKIDSVRVRNMGYCKFCKNSSPHGPVRARTRVVGRLRLGLGSGPRVVGRLGQEYGLAPVFKFSL